MLRPDDAQPRGRRPSLGRVSGSRRAGGKEAEASTRAQGRHVGAAEHNQEWPLAPQSALLYSEYRPVNAAVIITHFNSIQVPVIKNIKQFILGQVFKGFRHEAFSFTSNWWQLLRT